MQASMDAGCKIALVEQRMVAPNLSNEDKQKILKDLKEIGTSSPYSHVDYNIVLSIFISIPSPLPFLLSSNPF